MASLLAARDGEAGAVPAGRQRAGLAGLVALALATAFVGLGHGPPLGDHESINALAARYAIESGQWLIPHLGDTPRVRKTPLGIWLIGAASAWTGTGEGSRPVTEFSARLPSAVAGIANVFALVWLGSMLYGYRAGLVGGFICAGSVATLLYARNAQVDMVLTLFTTLSFACFWRGALHGRPSKGFMAAFYVALALAMLAKAPLPLATVVLPLGLFWFLIDPLVPAASLDRPPSTTPAGPTSQGGATTSASRYLGHCKTQVARWRTLWIGPGVVLLIVVVGAWPLYVYMHVDHALALWRTEYLDRFTGGLSSSARPLWYYVPVAFGLTAPFMASLPEAVAAPFLNRYGAQRRGLAYAFTWAAVGTGFLSAAAFKRPHYLLSVIPAYCLLLAPVIDRLFFGSVAIRGRLVRATCIATPVLLAAGAAVAGAVLWKDHPALLRPYAIAATAAFLVWTAACWTYARNRRAISFALLNLGAPIVLFVMWPAVAESVEFNAETRALAAGLRTHGVGPDDDLVWADQRPNAALEFYSGLRMRRLIDPNEVAVLRRGRRTVPRAVYREIIRRIEERFASHHPVYLVMSTKHHRALSQQSDLAVRVLFRLQGFHADAGDELVVCTQEVAVSREHRSRSNNRRASVTVAPPALPAAASGDERRRAATQTRRTRQEDGRNT